MYLLTLSCNVRNRLLLLHINISTVGKLKHELSPALPQQAAVKMQILSGLPAPFSTGRRHRRSQDGLCWKGCLAITKPSLFLQAEPAPKIRCLRALSGQNSTLSKMQAPLPLWATSCLFVFSLERKFRKEYINVNIF